MCSCDPICRLQEEVISLRNKAEEEVQTASVSAEEHQRRASEAERRLQSLVSSLEQQLKGREVELAEQRAMTAAVEQRAASLESALQQANGAAAAMASRITESVADAAAQVHGQLQYRRAGVFVLLNLELFYNLCPSTLNPQAESLKSRVALAEQQVSDLKRREAEARAEVNILTSSMAAQQQQQQQVATSGVNVWDTRLSGRRIPLKENFPLTPAGGGAPVLEFFFRATSVTGQGESCCRGAGQSLCDGTGGEGQGCNARAAGIPQGATAICTQGMSYNAVIHKGHS